MVARGPSRHSVDLMQSLGYDISDHVATMVEEQHVNEADLVLTMEVGHAEALRAEFPANAHKVFMLTEMIGRSYNIVDPYGGPYDEYERMVESLTEVIDKGMDRIVMLARENVAG